MTVVATWGLVCQRRTWKSHDHITTAALLGIAGVRLSAYSGCRACFQLAIQYYGVYNDSANLKQIPIMTKKKKNAVATLQDVSLTGKRRQGRMASELD